jgi:hypothetical protein
MRKASKLFYFCETGGREICRGRCNCSIKAKVEAESNSLVLVNRLPLRLAPISRQARLA